MFKLLGNSRLQGVCLARDHFTILGRQRTGTNVWGILPRLCWGSICIMIPVHTLAPGFTILTCEWVFLASFCLELGHRHSRWFPRVIFCLSTLTTCQIGPAGLITRPSSKKRSCSLVTPRREPPTFAFTSAVVSYTTSLPGLGLGLWNEASAFLPIHVSYLNFRQSFTCASHMPTDPGVTTPNHTSTFIIQVLSVSPTKWLPSPHFGRTLPAYLHN